jgi:hypothetical protein
VSYFSNFPSGMLKIGNEYKYVTDIFKRVYVKTPAVNYSEIETVTVPDGYTIEQASDLYYGAATYHWVIAIINNYVDIREEWPKSTADLLEYCKLKYGGLEGIYQVHHYEADGLTVQSSYVGTKTAVTNMEYEEKLNDVKREIKVLRPEYLTYFVTKFQTLISR